MAVNMVTIGVTGHRFLTEVDKISAGVNKALCQIEYAFGGQAWTDVSPLAETSTNGGRSVSWPDLEHDESCCSPASERLHC